MFGDLNQSSYYRANPYYQQGYLPDTAFKNRKMPSYMVEIPQGQQYFEPTNKKHFQRLGYYSTIAEDHIINPDPLASPATQKAYFRNLNIDDIEGAGTNTLISKAVKNRMKAKEYLQERDREKREEELRQKLRNMEQMEDQKKRMEALSKINRNQEPNYHEKMLKLKTEESQKQSPSPPYKRQENTPAQIQREQPSPIQNYHQQHYDHYQTELERTEREIRQLERQLRGNVHSEKTKESNNYNSLPIEKDYQLGPASLSKGRSTLPEQYAQKEPHTYSNRAPHAQYLQRFPQGDGHSQPAQSQPSYKKEIQNYRNYSLDIQPPNKFRSLTENKVTSGNQFSTQGPNQPEAQRGGGTPVYCQQNSMRPTRQQHRRINPTYLSYGSASIGLAGKNIIGY